MMLLLLTKEVRVAGVRHPDHREQLFHLAHPVRRSSDDDEVDRRSLDKGAYGVDEQGHTADRAQGLGSAGSQAFAAASRCDEDGRAPDLPGARRTGGDEEIGCEGFAHSAPPTG